MNPEMRYWTCVVALTLGVSFLLVGAIVYPLRRDELKSLYYKPYYLAPFGIDDINFKPDGFLNTTDLANYKSYRIFNVSNPVQAMNGAKPAFRFVGPFDYYHNLGTVNTKFIEEGNKYSQKSFQGFYSLTTFSDAPSDVKNLYCFDAIYINLVRSFFGTESNFFTYGSLVHGPGQLWGLKSFFSELVYGANSWYFLKTQFSTFVTSLGTDEEALSAWANDTDSSRLPSWFRISNQSASGISLSAARLLFSNVTGSNSFLDPLSWRSIWLNDLLLEENYSANILQEAPFFLSSLQASMVVSWKRNSWKSYLRELLLTLWAPFDVTSEEDFIFYHWLYGDALSGITLSQAIPTFKGNEELALVLDVNSLGLTLNFSRNVLPLTASKEGIDKIRLITNQQQSDAFFETYAQGLISSYALSTITTSPILWHVSSAEEMLTKGANSLWTDISPVPTHDFSILGKIETAEDASKESDYITLWTGRSDPSMAFAVVDISGSTEIKWNQSVPIRGKNGNVCGENCVKSKKTVEIFDSILLRSFEWEFVKENEEAGFPSPFYSYGINWKSPELIAPNYKFGNEYSYIYDTSPLGEYFIWSFPLFMKADDDLTWKKLEGFNPSSAPEPFKTYDPLTGLVVESFSPYQQNGYYLNSSFDLFSSSLRSNMYLPEYVVSIESSYISAPLQTLLKETYSFYEETENVKLSMFILGSITSFTGLIFSIVNLIFK